MMPPAEQLRRLLECNLLSRKNADRAAQVFYDAAKIIYERQKQLSKPQLKMKEVASALVLAETMHSQAFRFEAVGPLAENFGKIIEADALDYYDEKVMGDVKDRLGRTITIDVDGMRSLYKDRVSGKHEVAPENYEEVRGKRLPWIRHTIENSHAVYVTEETIQGSFRRTYLYTAIVSIPIQPKPQTNYYVVVVREGKNQTLPFVTAYSMFKRNKFINVIALSRPLSISSTN